MIATTNGAAVLLNNWSVARDQRISCQLRVAMRHLLVTVTGTLKRATHDLPVIMDEVKLLVGVQASP